MATWESLTLRHESVKARYPADFADITADVPNTDPTLKEAKAMVRRFLVQRLSPYVLTYPSVDAFLDRVATEAGENEAFHADVSALIAFAYRHTRFISKSFGDDRLAEAAELERREFKEAVAAFALILPNALGKDQSRAAGTRRRSRVGVYDAYRGR